MILLWIPHRFLEVNLVLPEPQGLFALLLGAASTNKRELSKMLVFVRVQSYGFSQVLKLHEAPQDHPN